MDSVKCIWEPNTLEPNAVSERKLSYFGDGGTG